jgi:hypothetical protein
MDNTFFNLKLDLEPNIIDMIYDILRMSTIQIIAQLMFYMNNDSLPLISETFIKTFTFINIGIIVYYLLIRKIFSFVSADYLRVTDDVYTHTPPMTKSATSNLPKAPAINPKLTSSETSISTPVTVPVPTIISKTSVTPKISNNNPNNQTNTSL